MIQRIVNVQIAFNDSSKYEQLTEVILHKYGSGLLYPSHFRLSLARPYALEPLVYYFSQNRRLLGEAYARNRQLAVTTDGQRLRQSISKNNWLSYCHYEGTTVGDSKAAAALNLCMNSFSGLLEIENQRFSIEMKNNSIIFAPLSQMFPDAYNWDYLLLGNIREKMQAQHLIHRLKRQTKKLDEATIERRPLPDYYKKYLDGKWRYVELVLVSDNGMYAKYNKDSKVVHERMVSIANMVNSLYYPLNIRITLVWAVVWDKGDQIEVSSDADHTLNGFLNYRKELLKNHPHDNAQLLTYRKYSDGIVGKAQKGTMCSYDYSGGINVDHSRSILAVASTVAHEMGHNFGMEHDNDQCLCTSGQNTCMMAPFTGGLTPTFWSDCSLEYLQHGLLRGMDYCLSNAPISDFGGAKCGNGIVETGEQCDCGAVEVCSNDCCHAQTCQFVHTARCAGGQCCNNQTCQVVILFYINSTANGHIFFPKYPPT